MNERVPVHIGDRVEQMSVLTLVALVEAFTRDDGKAVKVNRRDGGFDTYLVTKQTWGADAPSHTSE